MTDTTASATTTAMSTATATATTTTPARRQGDRRRTRRRLADDRGSATAEYAVVILAAVAFAGVLVAVMRSGEVQQILTDLVRGALVP